MFAAALYGFMTLFFAHTMREKAYLRMCPYVRFQSVVFNKDTLIIFYDAGRDEPRGTRKRTANEKDSGLGDYINRTMYVQVYPVGIDIRNGLQYRCIGCMVCIDACDGIMDEVGYERGLTRYTTEDTLKHEYPENDIEKRLRHPRVVGYSAVLLVIVIAFPVGVSTRKMIEVDIPKDRGVMIRRNNQDWLGNAYNLCIIDDNENE